MADKDDKKSTPVCKECGGKTRHYATLPKTHERPALIIYRCDDCGAVATTSAPS